MAIRENLREERDEILRGRYIERNFEKIIKILREPPPATTKDYLVIFLLLVLVIVIVFQPQGRIAESSRMLTRQDEIIRKVDGLQMKVDNLEKQLLALAGLDEGYDIIFKEQTGGSGSGESSKKQGESGKKEKPRAKETHASATHDAAKMAKPLKDVVDAKMKAAEKLHNVKPGDTLSTISGRYYDSTSPALIEALGRYNKLKGPNYDLWPGDTVRIPARSVLLQKKSE